MLICVFCFFQLGILVDVKIFHDFIVGFRHVHSRMKATIRCLQCSHSKFKLGVFIPPHFEIRGYEVKFEGMTF